MAALLGLCWALRPVAAWKRLGSLGLAFLGVAIIYFTHVRVTMIMLIISMVALALLLAMHGQYGKAVALTAGGSAMLVVAMMWAGANVGTRVFERLFVVIEQGPVGYSIQSRGGYAYDGIVQLFEHPLGYGLGWWGQIYSLFPIPNKISPVWVEVMIQAWVYDGGVPLWLGYVGAIVLALYGSTRIALTARPGPGVLGDGDHRAEPERGGELPELFDVPVAGRSELLADVGGVAGGRGAVVAGRAATRSGPRAAAAAAGGVGLRGGAGRAEGKGQRAKGKGQRAKNKGQEGQRANCKRGRAKGRGQIAEGKGKGQMQIAEGKGKGQIADCRGEGQRAKGKGQRTGRTGSEAPAGRRLTASEVWEAELPPCCPLPSVLCPLPSVLCPLPPALCPLSSALCPLPSALCPLSFALCPLSFALCPLPSAFLDLVRSRSRTAGSPGPRPSSQGDHDPAMRRPPFAAELRLDGAVHGRYHGGRAVVDAAAPGVARGGAVRRQYRVVTVAFGYLTLLELGLGGASGRSWCGRLSGDDPRALGATVGAGFRSYLAVTVLTLAVGLAMTPLVPRFAEGLAGAQVTDLQHAWLLGLIAFLSLLMLPFRWVIEARQLGYVVMLLLTLQSLMTTAVALVLARAGWGITGQSVAMLAGALVLNLGLGVVVR